MQCVLFKALFRQTKAKLLLLLLLLAPSLLQTSISVTFLNKSLRHLWQISCHSLSIDYAKMHNIDNFIILCQLPHDQRFY